MNLFGIESPGLTASLSIAEDAVSRLRHADRFHHFFKVAAQTKMAASRPLKSRFSTSSLAVSRPFHCQETDGRQRKNSFSTPPPRHPAEYPASIDSGPPPGTEEHHSAPPDGG